MSYLETRSALLIALLGVAAAPVAALQDDTSRIVQAIHWQGLQSVPEETARFYLGVAVGEPLDPETLNRGLHALWQSRLFEDLEVHLERSGEGLDLRIKVEERPRLSSLEFEGLGGRLTRQEVEERIAREGLHVGPPEPLARGELESLRQLMRTLLRERGSPLADVTYRLEPVGTARMRAVFVVTLRKRVRVTDIAFRGNSAFSERRLRRAMKRTRESGVVTRLLRLDTYDPVDLEEDLRSIRALYRDHGYKDVLLGEPQLEAGRRRTRVTIPIDEGERWTLGGLSVKGNRVFGDERLLSTFAGPRETWLRQSAVDAWQAAILETYLGDGRLETEVTIELRERPGRVVDLVALVEEGEQLRLGRLELVGNSRTRERVLRRELRVDEGEILDLGELQAGLQRIHQQVLFELEDEPLEFHNLDADAGTVDVLVTGKETKPVDIRFGGGWSEVYGVSAHLVLDTPNFLGLGHRAGLRLEGGGTRDGFELAYSVPWVLGRPQAVGLEVFDLAFDYSLSADQRFFRDERGGTLAWGRALGSHNVRTSYTWADLDDLQTGRDLAGDQIRRQLSGKKSSLRAAWIFDRRDQPLDPSRGFRLGADLEAAGGLLGGDDRFSKARLDFSWFQPLGRRPRTFLAFNLEGGWVEARGDQALSPLETFLLGGTQSLRGFTARSISARGADDLLLRDEEGFLVGGTRYLESSLELHLPFGGPFEAVLFADAGNVYAEEQSLDLSNLRTTAGAELRLRLPRLGLPLRLIYAVNLDPLAGDEFEDIQFSFGTSF